MAAAQHPERIAQLDVQARIVLHGVGNDANNGRASTTPEDSLATSIRWNSGYNVSSPAVTPVPRPITRAFDRCPAHKVGMCADNFNVCRSKSVFESGLPFTMIASGGLVGTAGSDTGNGKPGGNGTGSPGLPVEVLSAITAAVPAGLSS